MNENETIELTPSFPEKLEREAARLIFRDMPARPKLITAIAFIALILLGRGAFETFFATEFDHSYATVFIAGLLVSTVYERLESRLRDSRVKQLQTEARARDKPTSFRFTPKRFIAEMANARTDHGWSAVDEIAVLRGGTGLRVGVWTYPIADADLPEGLSPDAFRERLNGWRSAA